MRDALGTRKAGVMIRFARSAVALAGAVVLLTLAACGGSSPAPTPPSASPTPPLAELSALAGDFGAQEAWWMAVTQAEAETLVGDSSWAGPSSSPSATTYVVLMHGEFNDASGKPMGWAVTAGEYGADTLTRVMSARPEVSHHSWTALDLPSAEASP
jgi:hypothetical protein